MQWAYFSACCCSCVGLAGEPELGAPLPDVVLFAAPVDIVVPRLAIDGDFDPPHPAASSERNARPPRNNEQRTLEPTSSKKEAGPLRA